MTHDRRRATLPPTLGRALGSPPLDVRRDAEALLASLQRALPQTAGEAGLRDVMARVDRAIKELERSLARAPWSDRGALTRLLGIAEALRDDVVRAIALGHVGSNAAAS